MIVGEHCRALLEGTSTLPKWAQCWHWHCSPRGTHLACKWTILFCCSSTWTLLFPVQEHHNSSYPMRFLALALCSRTRTIYIHVFTYRLACSCTGTLHHVSERYFFIVPLREHYSVCVPVQEHPSSYEIFGICLVFPYVNNLYSCSPTD